MFFSPSLRAERIKLLEASVVSKAETIARLKKGTEVINLDGDCEEDKVGGLILFFVLRFICWRIFRLSPPMLVTNLLGFVYVYVMIILRTPLGVLREYFDIFVNVLRSIVPSDFFLTALSHIYTLILSCFFLVSPSFTHIWFTSFPPVLLLYC